MVLCLLSVVFHGLVALPLRLDHREPLFRIIVDWTPLKHTTADERRGGTGVNTEWPADSMRNVGALITSLTWGGVLRSDSHVLKQAGNRIWQHACSLSQPRCAVQILAWGPVLLKHLCNKIVVIVAIRTVVKSVEACFCLPLLVTGMVGDREGQ